MYLSSSLYSHMKHSEWMIVFWSMFSNYYSGTPSQITLTFTVIILSQHTRIIREQGFPLRLSKYVQRKWEWRYEYKCTLGTYKRKGSNSHTSHIVASISHMHIQRTCDQHMYKLLTDTAWEWFRLILCNGKYSANMLQEHVSILHLDKSCSLFKFFHQFVVSHHHIV